MAKFYRDPEFMDDPDARPLRILAEYLGPAARFHAANIKDTIVFFGSARAKSLEEAREALKEVRSRGGAGLDLVRAEGAVKLAEYAMKARELARRLTGWSKGLGGKHRRFVVCSGGGPGIMEAANRGASEAKGETIGLNISLPMEQSGNPYITRRLSMEFHYFFMRKYWFLYLAKALVIFPGGFGTLDELMEVLTLVQTKKVTKPIPIVVFGTDYWNEVLDLEAMVRWGTIDPPDVDLVHKSDSVEDAFEFLTRKLAEFYLEDNSDNHLRPPRRPPE